jgi:hypothetical protein
LIGPDLPIGLYGKKRYNGADFFESYIPLNRILEGSASSSPPPKTIQGDSRV